MVSRRASPLDADGQGTARGVERHQRAGGVEAEAADLVGKNSCLSDRVAHRGAGGGKNVGGRMLENVAAFAPDRDRPFGASDEPPLGVEHTRARAACSDVDADEGFVHVAPPDAPL